MRETHSMLLPRMATSRPLSPFNFETSLMGPDSDGEKVILRDQVLGAEHMAAPTNAALVKSARHAEPVDPAIRTTHLGQSIVECALVIGT
jgi:hypothetical protein